VARALLPRRLYCSITRSAVPRVPFDADDETLLNGRCQPSIASGTKDGDREAELVVAIEKIKAETRKTGQTLPALRRAIALILQDLKH
jgi:hypothetical protein